MGRGWKIHPTGSGTTTAMPGICLGAQRQHQHRQAEPRPSEARCSEREAGTDDGKDLRPAGRGQFHHQHRERHERGDPRGNGSPDAGSQQCQQRLYAGLRRHGNESFSAGPFRGLGLQAADGFQ